ncbi:MAG: NADH-quinone oxidoreductase subunit N [Actinobacteria bacterium]|nr:MAG: NADH-quinone oxidoreductase subunit N [Actinomycetota bacterium]
MIAAVTATAAATAGVVSAVRTQLPPLRLPSVEYSAILPELILMGAALALLLGSSLTRRRPGPGLFTAVTVAAALASMGAAWKLWADVVPAHGGQAAAAAHHPYTAMSGALAVDGFSVFFMVLLTSALVLSALLGDAWLRREGIQGPEYHVLALFCVSGAMLMAAANDLLVLFLALEILSIPLYVLAGFDSRRRQSREAAMKYFVLGAFSSALLLYGIALVYGGTGSTSLPQIATYLAQQVITSNGVLLAGLALLMAGLGFKVAAVPFHAWTPDVYQGAPSPVTGFMAAAAKAGGFAGLLRVFFSTFAILRLDWQPLVWVLAVLTLLVGSVLAVVQTDIKRMLAYSSISHAGFVLIGLQAGTVKGIAGALFYLLAYTFMVLGSFGIVTLVGRRGDTHHSLDDYRGLAGRRPGLALAFAVFLMAQTGVPFTTGFLAKFYVISAAVASRSYALAVIGMLSAVIAAFFYLRVIVLMYSPATGEDEAPRAALPRIPLPATVAVTLVVALAVTVVFGLVPAPMITFARKATLLF